MSLCLYLIRHGETEWALSKRHTGLTDIPLTANGKFEARELGPLLQGTSFSHVLTSPAATSRSFRMVNLAAFWAHAGLGYRLMVLVISRLAPRQSVSSITIPIIPTFRLSHYGTTLCTPFPTAKGI
ncbi:MAG: histidine phosphatase family protein [Pontiellaceae bacterium]|nr:histidine phosphatase family protein [Pontiellaceae bacterium]